MPRILRRLLVLVLAAAPCPGAAGGEDAAPNRIPWRAWDEASFARARAEGRLVLAVVSTRWCHWCHVMQRETYADPRVEAVIADAFLPLKADGDARPDLAERFRNYRWPATAFFTPDGTPILALRGFRSADALLAILGDVRARAARGGPFPGFDAPAPPATAVGEPDRAALLALRERLVRQLDAAYDPQFQGWGRGQKYPLAEPIQWGLRSARLRPTDAGPLRRSMDTLAAQEALLDPVWGGLFQYSVGPGWGEPHHEKLVEVNAGALSAYADALAFSGNERWRRDGATVSAWFERFVVTPEGPFRANQDAEVGGREATAYYRLDDAGRRRVGVPRVDPHVYARENGLAIAAHAAWSLASGDAAALARARRAAVGVLATHRDASGLLRHDASDGSGLLFLSDQAEMGTALLALARADDDPRWAREAVALAEALAAAFAAPAGGFFDTAGPAARDPRRLLEPNASAARFVLAAARLADRPAWLSQARRALLAVGDPGFVAAHGRHVGGLLLAVEEALATPRRVTLHGDPAHARRAALRRVVLRRLRADPDLVLTGAEGPGGAAGVPYAVVCEPDGTCRDPVETPEALEGLLGGSGGSGGFGGIGR